MNLDTLAQHIVREIESDPRIVELALSTTPTEFYASAEFAVIAEAARDRAVAQMEAAAREVAHSLRTDEGARADFYIAVHDAMMTA